VAVKHPVYRAVWLPAIRDMDRVIANSRATADLCRTAGVGPDRIGIVHPGVDLPETVIPLSPSLPAKGEEDSSPSTGRGSRAARGDVLSAAQGFRQRHNLANRPLLLSVGRLSARKGLREFVTRALPQIVAAYPDVTLLIVGDAPNQALHAQTQSPNSIRAAARQVGVADNLRFLGTITDYDELGTVYRAADVHVFPVREMPGDPEGFGMVAVEAAAHGLPTVAFATGGVVDAIAEGQSGQLVRPGDYVAFANAVLRALAEGNDPRGGCITFARQFAWPRFGKRIMVQLAEIGLVFARCDLA
jgi:phosphatidylinositol alpha-1,6-mannosyltransferase